MPDNRKRLTGRVVSDKMQKTVVVAVERRRRHPVYGKVVRTVRKVYAHDESDSIREGSLVRVVESRPRSKLKRWAVDVVLDAAPEPVAGEAVET